jgi:hypothetical protein
MLTILKFPCILLSKYTCRLQHPGHFPANVIFTKDKRELFQAEASSGQEFQHHVLTTC